MDSRTDEDPNGQTAGWLNEGSDGVKAMEGEVLWGGMVKTGHRLTSLPYGLESKRHSLVSRVKT